LTLTKTDLIESIGNRCGISKVKSAELLESILEMMKSTLESTEEVRISRFGKFSVWERSASRGRNPAIGNDMPLEARRIVTFRASSALRARMNGKSTSTTLSPHLISQSRKKTLPITT
jgi:integration host factor subunit alpha